MALSLFPVAFVRGRSKPAESDLHGSAKWADTATVREAGLGEVGVVVCQTSEARYHRELKDGEPRWVMDSPGALVADNSSGHVLCFAPTGQGKGGPVIGTLLAWLHSVVAYDPKGELWQITAGWRRLFSHVLRFEPTSETSVKYNPLFAIPRGRGDVREAQNIAEVLVPKDEKGKRDHWQLTAYKLLVGAILHVLYAGEKKDLRGVLELLSDPQRSIRETLEMMLKTPHLGDRPHPQVVSASRAALNKSDNELSGVVSTAETCLDLWLDPLIAENTASSDFCAEQLNSLGTPVSLYLVVPAADIERLRPLIRLMVIQIGNRLTRHVDIPGTGAVKPKGLRGLWQRICSALRVVQHAAKGGSKQRLLIILDEFPLLGYLPWIESAIAFLRGYKIKLFLIVQSLNQLEKVYGPNHAFLDNSWVRFTYTSFDDRTAERISNLLGKRTVVQTQVSKTRKAGAFWAQSYNESQQYTARPLKTAGELLTLPYDEVIVFAGGVPPYQGTKLQYFLHPLFVARANLPRPDSTREQLAELPRPLPAIEWRGLAPITAVTSAAAAAPTAPQQNLQPALEFFGADALADVEPYADAPFHDDEEAALLDASEAQEAEGANL
jgi:type IV secretion system protein VirD4